MSTELTVVTEPLGGGPLARAALAGRVPPHWYERAPTSASEWRDRVHQVRDSTDRAWLKRLAPAFSASGRAAERLQRAAAGGIVVTTGQQPGLFGGPIYTWSKALSALALADAIERSTGIAAAPVFWAATDDADFAEAASTFVALPGGAELLTMASTAPEGTPMSAVPLPDVSEQLGRLEAASGSAAYAPALDAARAAYAAGATVGGAYVALLRALLEPLGIAVLDASHRAVTEAARPTLESALRATAALEEALAEREREIEAAGYSPQVPLLRGLTLVHGAERGTKRRLRARDADDALARRGDVELGATVLLRPVVERAILPTVGYLAGPGEFAYFAQVSAVAEALGAQPPLALPRWSGTIVEPHVARLLERYGIDRDELGRPNDVETRLAREAMPTGARHALRELEGTIADGLARLRSEARELEVPDPVYEGARRQLFARLARLERRHVAAVRRRSVEVAHDVATARGALHPGGIRQERALNFIPLLARNGERLVAGMLEQAGAHAQRLVGG